MSADVAETKMRVVADLSDDEIIDAIAVLWGADGFDAEDDENIANLADKLGLDEGQEAVGQDTIDDLAERLTHLPEARAESQGCYGLRLTWAEWANRIVLMLAMKHGYEFARGEQEEIAAMLAGEGVR